MNHVKVLRNVNDSCCIVVKVVGALMRLSLVLVFTFFHASGLMASNAVSLSADGHKDKKETHGKKFIPHLLDDAETDSMTRNFRSVIIKRIYNYSSSVDTSFQNSVKTYNYMKYSLNVDRRNFLLMCVPSMYHVAHGDERSYLGETYNTVNVRGVGKYDVRKLANINTFPHSSMAMSTVMAYLTPHIYNTTIFADVILSPFNKHNHLFYKYRFNSVENGIAYITFKPKLDNTQLVSGKAAVDVETGRVLSTDINGEYDMLRYSLNLQMGTEGKKTLYPMCCNLNSRFSLLGNKVRASVFTVYDMPAPENESLLSLPDTAVMRTVRPQRLSDSESGIYNRYEHKRTVSDSIRSSDDKAEKNAFWETLGQNMLTNIRGKFGNDDVGAFRLSPIINPLYLGYSKRRGVTYRMKMALNYRFTQQKSFELKVNAGYSFKEHLLYFTLPATFVWNKSHNAYVRAEVGNGNRITNTTVLDFIKEIEGDSVYAEENKLMYFNDFKARLYANYDFNNYFGMAAGVVTHNRTAVYKMMFQIYGQPTEYCSFAPWVELTVRPLGRNGPVLKADYERSIRGPLGSDMNYERWEFDCQHVMHLSRLQTMSMRLGTGFYTDKEKGWRFLDYTNFRDNNIPGGWNDEWSGEFELLGRNRYNMSKYYVRANATYESPILLASWIPLIGRFIEMERIYASSLAVHHLHPYTEVGYGFTTRLFSMGMFAAFENQHYNGIGFKFGFELFRRW